MANTHSIDLELSSSQYLSITDANQTGLDITGDISFEAWVKIEQLPSTAGTAFNIISKRDGNTDDESYSFSLTTTDTLRVIFSSNGGTVGATDRTLVVSTAAAVVAADVGNWVHLAAVADVSGPTVTMYKNGKAIATTTLFNAATSIYDSNSSVRIGGLLSSTTNFFDGKLDDVRVWNDIRTAQEIQDNMQVELVGTEANLQGYWKLNNALTDSTSNANTLTNNNSASFSTDAGFQAKSIDLEASSSQYLSITDALQTGLDITTDFTIEAWIKLESLPSVSGVDGMIVSKDDRGGTRGYQLNISGGLGNLLYIYFVGSSGTTSTRIDMDETFDADDLGVWIHIAVAVDISGPSATFYKNGVAKSDTVTTSDATSIDNTSEPFQIGAGLNTTAERFFDGLIDEVRVWNDIRTGTEISDNYDSELVGDEGNLVGYWRLDNNFVDQSGNGNTLVNNNTAVFSTDVPFVELTHVANVTIDNTKVAGDLTDYPAYIDLSDLPTDFWDVVKYDGGDIRCFKSDGTTELPREVVYCNTGLPDSTHSISFVRSSSQYLQITDANQTGLDITGDFTFECWVNLTQLPSTASDSFGIIQKGDDHVGGPGDGRGYQFFINDDDILWVVFEDSSNNRSRSFSTSAIVTSGDVGKWVHLAVSYDMSENTATMYKNGESVAVTDDETNADSIKDTDEPFNIGSLYYSAANMDFFDGKIDDVRVWKNTIRTPAEIAENMNSELVGTETGLTGYWKLNNSLLDETSNDNDLSNPASATFSTDTPEGWGELHVKYTGTLSSSTDTVIQIHADGVRDDYVSSATYGSENVWKSEYDVVSHNSGGTDSTSNGNDGSGQGSISIGGTTGKIGSATDFDGTDDYISIPSDDSINFGASDSFSVSIWFKTDVDTDISLFDKTVDSNQEGYRSSIRSDNHYIESSIEQADDTNTEITTGTAVNDDEWHQFTFVRDVTNDKLYAYLDGGSDATPVTDTTTASLSSATALLIGAKDLSPIARFFNGLIDEFRIISEALSADWITTEYNNQSAPATFYSTEVSSPSSSTSPSSSESPSISPSSSESSSISPSSSESPSISPSSSESSSLSPSSSESPSISPSSSESPSISPSSSESPSISPSASISPSSSESPSISPSSSESPSISPSSSESPSISPSASISPSSSESPSISPSSSESPSISPSSSESPSISPSSSESPSISPSSSESPSISPSSSESSSASPSSSESSSLSTSSSASQSIEADNYTKEEAPVLPGDNLDLENAYTEQDYIDVSADDGNRVGQTATQGYYAIHEFKNDAGDNTLLDLVWDGQTNLAPSSYRVRLQIYNQNTTSWETIATNNTAAADTDFTLEARISDLTNYKDLDNVVSCRVSQAMLD